MYITDSPIKKVENDLLGRDKFAHKIVESIKNYNNNECLTIGIYGGWGNGKSSLANMIINEITVADNNDNTHYCVIKFNPWLFSNQKDLLTQLFSYISDAFNYSDTAGTKEKMAKGISIAGKAIGLFGHIPIPIIGSISKEVSEIFKEYADVLKGKNTKTDENKSLMNLKEKINKTLKDSKIKLIITIDDFDRLSQEEIRLMFQVVKVLGDFNHTIYLLLFDKDVVVESLKGVQGGDGNDYLKKIIQVPLTLPPIREDTLKEIVFEKFSSIIEYENLSHNDKSRISSLYNRLFKAIVPYITNLRDVNRLINLFNFKYGFLRNEVNPLDLLTLCILEISESDLFNTILQYKDNLSTIKSDLAIYKFLTEKDKIFWSGFEKTGFNNFFDSTNNIYMYFSLELPAQYISSSEKENIIFNYDPDNIERIINSHIDDIPGLVDSIQRKYSEIKPERCPFLIKALEYCFIKSQVSIRGKITHLVLNLVSKTSQDDIEKIFKDFQRNINVEALIPFYTDILFYLKQNSNDKIKELFPELVFDNPLYAINSPPNIRLDVIEDYFISALSNTNIFDYKGSNLKKLYFLCKYIDISYLKRLIPSDYAQNKAAFTIVYYEIEDKVEETDQGSELIFYVNISSIKRLLNLEQLHEYFTNKEKLPLDFFVDANLSEKIKAFLVCLGKEPDVNGICKINYQEELQRVSIDTFWK